MLAEINLLRPNLWALAFAAITVIAGVTASSNVSASVAGSDSGAAVLAGPNTWLAVGHAGDLRCLAHISGAWTGRIAFQVVGDNDHPEIAHAVALDGSTSGDGTASDGVFVWQTSRAKACRVAMMSYRSGSATIDLAASAVGLPALGADPNYVTYYFASPTPTPSPITSAYAAVGAALGAGNIYNTATNGFGVNGTAMLNNGGCFFLCYGAPGIASSNVLAIGNDYVTPAPGQSYGTSYTTIGAPDSCGSQCPGGISNQIFAITSVASPEPTNSGYFVSIDGSGNFAVANNLYAAAAIIAGAGRGTPHGEPSPNPVPSFIPGSLVSYTGTTSTGAGEGDILLGDASDYVKCDYGETTATTLTCSEPVSVRGPVQSAVSTGATLAPVGPCYEHNSSSCASSFHVVKNGSSLGITTNGSCANNSWCSLNQASISFTGSTAQFSNNWYSCSLSSQSSYLLSLLANDQTTIGFNVQAYNSSGSTIASGTDLGISYACFGA